MDQNPGSNSLMIGLPPAPIPEDEIESITRRLEHRPQFKRWNLLLTVLSIVLYIVDTVFDISTAYTYYTIGSLTYCWLTIGFVVIPAFVVTIFSAILYTLDSEKSGIDGPSCWHKVLIWIFCILPLGPLFRDFNVLYYGVQSWRALIKLDLTAQENYYKLMLFEESDSAFLRLFERYLEAAPQATLQVFIWLHHICDNNVNFDGINFRISILLSFVSLAWSLTNFNSTARTTNVEKQLLTGWGKAFQFSWQFCMIVSRVCALAFFAASHQIWIVPVCVLHWTVMLIWLSYLDSKYKKNPQTSRTLEDKSSYGHCTKILQYVQKSCTVAVFAFVYIFAFFNTEEKPTRVKYFIFYALCFVENTIFIATSINSSTQFEVVCVAMASYVLFFLGFAFMFVYYQCFHPSLRFSTMDGALKHVFYFKPTSDNRDNNTRRM